MQDLKTQTLKTLLEECRNISDFMGWSQETLNDIESIGKFRDAIAKASLFFDLTPHENPIEPKPLPEKYRVTKGSLATTSEKHGFNGMFIIPYRKIGKVQGQAYKVIISDGFGWQHVSVSIFNAPKGVNMDIMPTWEDMCFIKDLFWNSEEAVVQIHPPKSMYVNNHKYRLHLWNCTVTEMPLPHPLMVGVLGYDLGESGRQMAIKTQMKEFMTFAGENNLQEVRVEPKGEFSQTAESK